MVPEPTTQQEIEQQLLMTLEQLAEQDIENEDQFKYALSLAADHKTTKPIARAIINRNYTCAIDMLT